ncbi:hypothetical protein SAMN05660462_02547 [Proteiniborus ethanoligenes]|uniref:Uncharacterized protein n=1 Tax=Proteiniborus ethanoligenes TaxID=415015 RepID=A0A1H3RTB2_9FIRM|nr:hypothetical protein [Proteiniborus ethanoligenes]SDZ28943.1 hypothetical protein SAMN05660462_02547 [Proteiniborus ethanoligenes]
MKRLFSLMLVMVMLLSVGTEVFAASTGWKDLTVKDRVRYENGNINLKELGINIEEIIGFDILKENKRDKVHFSLEKDKVEFETELKLNTDYRLRVITENDKINVNFKTEDLPVIKETGDVIVVKVPAMPEKGFKWPYYLRIPSNEYKEFNKSIKRYLMVDMLNTGARIEGGERLTKFHMEENFLLSVGVAEGTYSPLIIPIIPRTNTYYNNIVNNVEDENMVYEHQLDRDSLLLKDLMKDKVIGEQLKTGYSDGGYNINDFVDIDKQVLAMIDHAIAYLNKYDHKVENKVMWNGFSASGEFANRFTLLYPHRVKVMVTGGAMAGTIIPLETYKGEELIYPIGVSEYEKITGRKFNLDEQNKVAKLTYVGELDTNDPLMSSDTYGKKERELIIKLFGKEFKARTKNTVEAYKSAGGKGAFVYAKDTGHWASYEIFEYIIQFVKDNRDSEDPVYKLPVGEEIKKALKVEIY